MAKSGSGDIKRRRRQARGVGLIGVTAVVLAVAAGAWRGGFLLQGPLNAAAEYFFGLNNARTDLPAPPPAPPPVNYN